LPCAEACDLRLGLELRMMAETRATLQLLLLLAIALVGASGTGVEEVVAEELAAFGRDDECRSSSEECALNALQRRGDLLSGAGAGAGAAGELAADAVSSAPDFEFREDNLAADGGEETELVDDFVDDMKEEGANTTALAQGGAMVTGCYSKDPKLAVACPLGTTCVVKWDGKWSQCMDCSSTSFGHECQKLDDYMRYAAVHTCKRTCMDTKCYNNAWCLPPYQCVTDRATNWGQCVWCHSKKFWHASCHALKPTMLHNAQHVCHRHCKY